MLAFRHLFLDLLLFPGSSAPWFRDQPSVTA